MKKWKECPFVLRGRVWLTLSAGAGIAAVSAIVSAVSHDPVLPILGGILLTGSTARAAALARLILLEDYEAVTGTCSAVTPLGRCQRISLADSGGNEAVLLLGRQVKVRTGEAYRIYLRNGSRALTGNERLDAVLSQNTFLGCEPLLPEK